MRANQVIPVHLGEHFASSLNLKHVHLFLVFLFLSSSPTSLMSIPYDAGMLVRNQADIFFNSLQKRLP